MSQREYCTAHPGMRRCCGTRQLGPHKVNCPASYSQRSAMTCHEKSFRHANELTRPEPRTFCWVCGQQLDEVPLFSANHWEDQRVLGFCSKPHYETYRELISLWA